MSILNKISIDVLAYQIWQEKKKWIAIKEKTSK